MSQIHAALIAAMKQIAKTGIAKTSRANLGGATVNYRGIEAAMNEMSAVLINCGITVTPTYSDVEITERAKAEAGKATRFCSLKGAFTFTSAEDASSVTSTVYGEAMDSGDKAVVKAQSVAFRTALFQQFVIPTMAMDPEADGDNDRDEADSAAIAAAERGTAAYQTFWKSLDAAGRRALEPHHAELKAIAAETDAGLTK